mgnify:CR=1 FL=1
MTITITPSGSYKFGPVTSTASEDAPKRTKSEAWSMCVAAGLQAGVRPHEWCKCHSRYGWAWYSKKKAGVTA